MSFYEGEGRRRRYMVKFLKNMKNLSKITYNYNF